MTFPELILQREATWQPNYLTLPEYGNIIGYRLAWTFVENDQWGRPWWATHDEHGTELVRAPATELLFHAAVTPITPGT